MINTWLLVLIFVAFYIWKLNVELIYKRSTIVIYNSRVVIYDRNILTVKIISSIHSKIKSIISPSIALYLFNELNLNKDLFNEVFSNIWLNDMWPHPVWPDVEKKLPILAKFAQEVARAVFTEKVQFFKIAQEETNYLATFERKLVAKIFQK